jgi:dihydroflavonol-4-reductase
VRALVTGAAGFIGSNVVRALLGQGAEVRALHLPGEELRNLAGLDVERFPGDVTDPGRMRQAVAGCDRVFHLAAVFALWMPRPERMREVNVEGTRTVLTACADAGVARVVYTSSIAVFGGQGRGVDATEQSPFRLGATGDLYSRTKSESHAVARAFVDHLDLTIVAPCGPLGPGDVGPTPTGRLLLSVLNLPAAVVVDSATCFLDVRDCAQGHLLAAAAGRRGETYLLGAENLGMPALARMAMEEAGVRKPIITVPFGVARVAARAAVAWADRVSHAAPLITPAAVAIARLQLRARCDKAREELAFRPRPVRAAVRDALRWFAANGYVRSRAVARRVREGTPSRVTE